MPREMPVCRARHEGAGRMATSAHHTRITATCDLTFGQTVYMYNEVLKNSAKMENYQEW
jgi:hypothetical protein